MKIDPMRASAEPYQLPKAARAAVMKMGTEIQAAQFLASLKPHRLPDHQDA